MRGMALYESELRGTALRTRVEDAGCSHQRLTDPGSGMLEILTIIW